MSAARIDLPDFGDLCEAACLKLWGEPDSRDRKELRWKGHNAYSTKTFNLKKRTWYDHGEQRGGSTLELVAYAKGQPKERLRGVTFFDAWREAHRIGLVPDPPPDKKRNGGGGPIIATYDYQDEVGQLIFQVCRFDAADPSDRFRQRRPDGKGGWIWDIKGVRTHILYRLPALMAAVKAGKRILICEGERDANTAVAVGFEATTMLGGVNKWFSEYDGQFVGADIVIVSDNDQQERDEKTGEPKFHPDGKPILRGQDHAAKLAKRLGRIAAHVRSIIFPQKDLSEWREAGGTRAALEAMIDSTPDLAKQADRPPPPPGVVEDSDKVLDELNLESAVVKIGAKTRVLQFEITPHEVDGERYIYRIPTYLAFEDFRNFYLNRYVMNEDGGRVSAGHWWLSNPRRRQYDGVVFQPNGAAVIEGKLNLWTGFGVEPRKGEWGRMREHIFHVLAARDDPVDFYIVNWLAFAVQHPELQAQVALVFLGGVGTGKGILGRAMCRIFGPHACHVSAPDDLTGHFNAHLQQTSFLFADEAYASQDRKAEGQMKRLITEDTLRIEPKGINRYTVPNHLSVMLASNHKWVVPAEERERRYQAQRVAETHQQSREWFDPLYKEMRVGGLQAMLHDLLDRNLDDWHPRQIVRTAALGEQQEESLSPLDQWWFELLQTGVLEGVGNKRVPNEAISNAYEEESVVSEDQWGKRKALVKRPGLYDQARRISPKLKAVSDTALGRYLGEQRCQNTWVMGGSRNHRGWRFPPLVYCRDKWCERFAETAWRDPEIAEWTFGDD